MRRSRIALLVVLALGSCRGETPPTKPAPGGAVGLLSASAAASQIRALASTQWFGLYLDDKKLGWARLAGRRSRAGEPGGFLYEMELHMRVGGAGASGEATLASRWVFADAPPYRLVELTSRESSGTAVSEHRFVNGDRLEIHDVVDGVAHPVRYAAASKTTAALYLSQYALDPAALHAGASFTAPDFDTDGERDKDTSLTVAEVRHERVRGIETEVAVLHQRTAGEQAETEEVVAAGGQILSAKVGKGLALRGESEATAKSAVVGFDIIGDAVPIGQPLGEPTAVDALHLVVSVADGFRLRDAPNQRVTPAADGRLDVVLARTPGLAVLPDDRQAGLAVTAAVDFDTPAIRDLAAQLTAGIASDRDKASRLVHYVYHRLDKSLATNLSTASQVLARGAGDCTEHTLLFVALARAAGVPARELSGLMYMGDAVQRFGFHAWAEVAIDGRWVAVDPTWDEEVADATHITLGVGDDSDYVMTLGHVKLEVATP